MEIITVSAIIIFFVFLNSLTFIVGALNTPLNHVFLGTVHWTGDYFLYLSQFAQGADHWVYNLDLYTHDFTARILVGWINVFLGHIFRLAGIDHLTAYQLSIVIFAFLFLLSSYALIREIFANDPKNKSRRRKAFIAFLLFVTASAFPKLVMEKGSMTISYFDYWFNNGIPFNRLGGVPHHLVARTCISLIILLTLLWWKRKEKEKAGLQKDRDGRSKWKHFLILLSLPVLGFVLASAEPVHWMETVAVLFITITLYKLHRITKLSRHFKSISSRNPAKRSILIIQHFVPRFLTSLDMTNKFSLNYFLSQVIFDFIPCILLFLGGLPMVLYLKKITSFYPYAQLVVWEASQQLHIDFLSFVMGNGPVLVLAILGFFYFIKNITIGKLTAIVFVVATVGLYLSPIPQLLNIVNVRFLPATTTIFFACMATEAIFVIAEKLRKGRNLSIIAITGLVILIHIPVIYMQLQERIVRVTADTNNAFFYVPKNVIEAYKTAENMSSTNDTFLMIWPFNWSFPGIAGRRVYHGHTLLTIDYEAKDKIAVSFFDNKMKKGEMESFLALNKISYIMTYSWTESVAKLPLLTKVYDNNYLAIFKVKGL